MVKGQTVFGGTPYGMVTDYVSVPAGTFTVGGSARRFDQKRTEIPANVYTIKPGGRYTGIALGRSASFPHARLLVFEDQAAQDVPSDKSEVRVIDAYPQTTNLDIVLNNIVAFSGLTFGSRCQSITLPAKLYYGKAIRSGDYEDPVSGPVPLLLDGGEAYQLIVLGPSTPHQPGMMVIPDN